MPGYQQVLENLVYAAIHAMIHQKEEYWEPLQQIVSTCAITYNIEEKQILADYEQLLEKQLLKIVYQ